MLTDGCEADDVAEVGWQIHALDFLACTQHRIIVLVWLSLGTVVAIVSRPDLSHQVTASSCPGY